MSHYLRVDGEGKSLGVWEITETEATRIGVSNPRQGPGCYFKAEQGEAIFDAIRRGASDWFGPGGENPFHETALAPGYFYRRMARPPDQHPLESPGFYPGLRHEQDALAMTRSQVAVLSRLLDRICQTIHPSPENMAAYGADIRNLLILAATEVEAQWKGILVANGVVTPRLTTNDYVKLLKAMQLDSYSVSLAEYPSLSKFAPFENWNASTPTQSLRWYEAYNSTKHDRESAFSKATLEHAIDAVCATVVMIAAQYGSPLGLGHRTELSDKFKFLSRPVWAPGDVYTHPYGTSEVWSPTNYPF